MAAESSIQCVLPFYPTCSTNLANYLSYHSTLFAAKCSGMYRLSASGIETNTRILMDKLSIILETRLYYKY